MFMDAESMKLLAAALSVGMGALAAAPSISAIARKSVEGISRNPEATSKIQPAMILAIAFTEAIAIYALVISLIILFV